MTDAKPTSGEFKQTQKSENASDIDIETNNHLGTASNASALYHVVCVIAGVGILNIPNSLMQAGWVAVALLFFSAFINDYTGKMLVKCLYQDGKRIRGGYPDVGRMAFGRGGEIAVQIFFNSILLGAVCLFLILSGKNLHTLVDSVSVGDWILICAAFVLIPIVALRTLKEVAIVSFFGAFATVIVTIIVCVYGFIKIANREPDEVVTYKGFDLSGLAAALSTYSLSYGGNFVYPDVELSMKTPKMFPRILTLAIIIITVLYASTGIVGYAAYAQNVEEIVLANLDAGVMRGIALGIITAHSLLACPLILTTFSAGIERWFKIDTPKDTIRSWCIRNGVRVSTVMVCTFIAYVLPFFKDVLNFIGAVSGTVLIYIFPVLFYYKLFGIKGRSNLELGFAAIILVIGAIGGSLGAYDSVRGIIINIQKSYGSA